MQTVVAYCPNCSADLKEASVAACWNCDATFTARDGWRPTAAPVGTFREIKRPAAEAATPTESETPARVAPLWEKLLRAAIGLPLILAGLLLLYVSMGQLGMITGIPGALCIVSGLGLIISRSAGATMVWGVVGGLLSLLIYGGLVVVGAAIASR